MTTTTNAACIELPESPAATVTTVPGLVVCPLSFFNLARGPLSVAAIYGLAYEAARQRVRREAIVRQLAEPSMN